MTLEQIQITFVGMEPTEAIKKYVLEKIGKYERLWRESTRLEVYFKEFINSKGVKNDFRVDINVVLPKSNVRVEVTGENMYANIDEASDTLARRLKRYTIAVRKKIEDIGPLEEGEAIERMELLGYDQFLFRSKSTGKISMIYKREQGGYGLIEPADSEV
ncbi:MAG: hypothetical protein UR36_C0018G0026 [candidate division WS6 bacterium GW2011_GWF1_33_233]|nr:MAG: hypothetical protein UR36_C0018G0026 [candidate division WS6 bacterium GW2011_GWF1_33_233]